MFPETFVEGWVHKITKIGDVILDPFCGRGTLPFQALLMNRGAIAADINPVAYCVSRAKTSGITRQAVIRRMKQLEREFDPMDRIEREYALPEFFRHAYSVRTLRQILYLRRRLRFRSSSTDCMLAALVLGSLHGESEKSPVYLSSQMPHTISTKPAYSIRFWRRHGLKPPERDAFALLRRMIDYRYASPPVRGIAEIFETDMRELPRLLANYNTPIRHAITSPPYLNVTSYEEDQWLRLWFLGGPPHPTYRRVSRDDRHERPCEYWALIGDMWRSLGLILAERSHVVIRLGAVTDHPERLVDPLHGAAVFAGRSVRLLAWELSDIRHRQTDSFRPGAKGCKVEVDCHFLMK